MSDCEKILDHLRKHGSITSWEAIQRFRCTRLSGRIFDLRKRGYVISATTEESVNAEGEKTRYSRYRLEDSNGTHSNVGTGI